MTCVVAKQSFDTPLEASIGARAFGSYDVQRVSDLASLSKLGPQWRLLEQHTQHPPSVFQSFDWVMAWSEVYAQPNSANTLNVLVGFEGKDLAFVWPLMRQHRQGFTVLTWLSEPFGQYGDVLCRKGSDAARWINATISFLKREGEADILRQRHVRDDSHLAIHARGALVDTRQPDKAPYLDLRLFENEAAYAARYKAVQRNRRKRILKSLENLGPVEFSRLRSGPEVEKAIEEAFEEKNRWLREKGRLNRVLADKGHIPFLKTLLSLPNGRVDVVVTEMRAGQEALSWQVSFRYCGTHYGYMTAHRYALTHLSPARLHMDFAQREALQQGVSRYDLMLPNDAHKQSWSSDSVGTNDYFIPLSGKGWLFGHVYLRNIRPLLRKFYYWLDSTNLLQLFSKIR